jgi:hypothetical protein
MLPKTSDCLYTLTPVRDGFLLRRVAVLAVQTPGPIDPPDPSNPDAWLEKSIIKHCTGRQLSASQYRSQYLTRSKHQLYSKEYIASCMAYLAASGVLEARPSVALNPRGGIYYTTVVPNYNPRPCPTPGHSGDSLEAEIAPTSTENPGPDCCFA